MIGLNKIGLNQVQLNRLRLNAPFPAYGKMAGGGGSGDGFPQLPGDVTRWHFGGLTNEMMAAMDDPRIEDVDHKGRFLSFKNFAWKGMSGVGGYVQDFNDFRNNATVDKVRIDEQSSNSIKVTLLTSGMGHVIYIPKDVYQFNKSYFIKISSEGYNEGDLFLSFYAPSTSTATTVKVPLNPNGITEIPAIKEDDYLAVYLFNAAGKVGSITIEQLPLYPGALVFDGVDDYGVCENFPILTKERGYTVVALRQRISTGEGIRGLVSNVKNWFKDGAFILEYSYTKNSYFNRPVSFGAIGGEKDLPHILTYQTSKSYNGVSIAVGSFIGTDQLYVGKIDNIIGNCTNAAIWELVFLDHDATEEELTKIKDYFVKTYPWLFPDQAWTVAGKTNEDEDRATIANITGNGNNLVLSNFGFAEGSGYGLYAYNFNSFELRDNVVKPTDVKKDSFRIIGIGDNGNVLVLSNTSNSAAWKIRITGMKEGDSCIVGNANKSGDYIKIIKDGIYTFQKQYAATSINGIWYNSSQEVDVLVEQIPEYEGYLITDGVDDEIISAKLIQFADKFTIVGDWKFMEDRNDNAGLLKANQIYIYNATTGMRIYLKQGSKNYPFSCKKINALTSDGWVYDEKWDKYKVYPIGSDIDISSRLFLGFYSSNFTKIALKNLGIYNDQLLSKDDCIKAYNYLQTLKAK